MGEIPVSTLRFYNFRKYNHQVSFILERITRLKHNEQVFVSRMARFLEINSRCDKKRGVPENRVNRLAAIYDWYCADIPLPPALPPIPSVTRDETRQVPERSEMRTHQQAVWRWSARRRKQRQTAGY